MLDTMTKLRNLDPAWYRNAIPVVCEDFNYEYKLFLENSHDKLNGVKVEKIQNIENDRVRIKFLEGEFQERLSLVPSKNIKRERKEASS